MRMGFAGWRSNLFETSCSFMVMFRSHASGELYRAIWAISFVDVCWCSFNFLMPFRFRGPNMSELSWVVAWRSMILFAQKPWWPSWQMGQKKPGVNTPPFFGYFLAKESHDQPPNLGNFWSLDCPPKSRTFWSNEIQYPHGPPIWIRRLSSPFMLKPNICLMWFKFQCHV